MIRAAAWTGSIPRALARRGLRAPVALFCVLLLSGCWASFNRMSSDGATLVPRENFDPVDLAYRDNLAVLVAGVRAERVDLAYGLATDNPVVDHTDTSLRQERLRLGALAAPLERNAGAVVGTVSGKSRTFTARWRTSRQTVRLAPANPQSGNGPFYFSGLQARQVEIQLEFALKGTAHLTCDGPVTLRMARARRTIAAGAPIRVAGEAGAITVLEPDAAVNACSGETEFGGARRPLRILREEAALPWLADLDARYDLCAAPGEAADALERAFMDPRWLSQTCPMPIGSPVLLPGEREGFDAKVAALLGTALPERFHRSGDPELPLDFSRAPRLDLIHLSYLDIKADFSGRIIDRLVRHHAARGTRVRILTSGVLERDKDRAMLAALAADHPNVEVRIFSWTPPQGATVDLQAARFHRVNHAKMLVALSREPGGSTAILGGRNIHDGFLFDDPLDLTRYPALQQYGRSGGLSLNYYSNWRDLDIAVHEPDAVRTLAAHLATLWHADAETLVTRPFSIAVRGGPQPRPAAARHFLSVPYADGRALETYYAGLIDAARHKVEIVNPYLSLTPALAAALERAVERGVVVTIVGRIDLSGDLGGGALTALNRLFVERYADRIAIYDYRDKKVLLHAKILMIDARLATISSVNLNHRSFIHDTENGIAMLDRAQYERVKAVFERYRAGAERVGPERVPLAWRLLFSLPVVRDAL